MLDTNVLVSALLFKAGRLSWLRQSWQQGTIKPLLAEATTRDLLRVLAYPKFRLTAVDIKALLAELLPWCETWTGPLEETPQRVRDPREQVFWDLAASAKAAVLVSGDADVLVLRDQRNPVLILDPATFREWLRQTTGR